MEGYAIEMLGITKAFPGVVANDNVTLTVLNNEVLALLGENGAQNAHLGGCQAHAAGVDEGLPHVLQKAE